MTQLVILLDEICKNMQMWKQTDLILLGFSKVFNKVAHKTNFKITILWNLTLNWAIIIGLNTFRILVVKQLIFFTFSIYCQTLFQVLSAGVLCTLRVAG